MVYLQNGKKDRALASWRAALEMDPDNREARALLEKYGCSGAEAGTEESKAGRSS
jgi:cytochrome c-type biogenesis protein CcmH/NrfG